MYLVVHKQKPQDGRETLLRRTGRLAIQRYAKHTTVREKQMDLHLRLPRLMSLRRRCREQTDSVDGTWWRRWCYQVSAYSHGPRIRASRPSKAVPVAVSGTNSRLLMLLLPSLNRPPRNPVN